MRMPNYLCRLRDNWSKPQNLLTHELHHLTPWEQNGRTQREELDGLPSETRAWEDENGLIAYIESVAGKEELTRMQCVNVIHKLVGGSGPDGRVLTDPVAKKVAEGDAKNRGSNRFSRIVRTSVVKDAPRESVKDLTSLVGAAKRMSQMSMGGDAALPETGPMAKFRINPKDVVDTNEFARWLVGLEWSFKGGDALDTQIAQLYERASRAHVDGDRDKATQLSFQALRLEGCKTRKSAGEAELPVSEEPPRNRRLDVYHQNFLKPHRLVDEKDGRTKVMVRQSKSLSTLGG